MYKMDSPKFIKALGEVTKEQTGNNFTDKISTNVLTALKKLHSRLTKE